MIDIYPQESIDDPAENERIVLQKQQLIPLANTRQLRGAQIAHLQQLAEDNAPKTMAVDALIQYANLPIAKWKNGGSIEDLNIGLSAIAEPNFVAAMAYTLESGETVLEYIIQSLK